MFEYFGRLSDDCPDDTEVAWEDTVGAREKIEEAEEEAEKARLGE